MHIAEKHINCDEKCAGRLKAHATVPPNRPREGTKREPWRHTPNREKSSQNKNILKPTMLEYAETCVFLKALCRKHRILRPKMRRLPGVARYGPPEPPSGRELKENPGVRTPNQDNCKSDPG